MWISGGMGLGFSLEAADSDKIWITTKVILTNHICLRDKSQSPPPPVPVRIIPHPVFVGVVISDHIFILGGIARYQNISGKMFFFMISTLFEIPINPDQS